MGVARQRQIRSIPMRRFATPTDIANTRVVSRVGRSSFVTGEALNVTGGEEVH